MPDQTSTDKSIPALVSELVALVRAYIQQETLEPVKDMARGAGRYVLWGLLGSLSLGVGLILLAVALLRALQSETGTVFAGNWSFVPYLVTLVACVVVIGLAASRMGKRGSRA